MGANIGVRKLPSKANLAFFGIERCRGAYHHWQLFLYGYRKEGLKNVAAGGKSWTLKNWYR